MQMRGELTRDTYNRMLNAASTASNQAAQADAQLINVTLIRNKVNNLAFPETDEDKAASLVLRQNIEDTLRKERQAGPMTEARRQEIVDNAIMWFGSSGNVGFWATIWGSGKDVPDMPLMAMTPEQERLATDKYKVIEGVRISEGMYNGIVRDMREKGVKQIHDSAVLTQFQLEGNAGRIRTLVDQNDPLKLKIDVPLDRYYAIQDAIRDSGSEGTDQQILDMYKKER